VHEDGILSVSVPKRGLQRRQLVICTPDPAATEEAGDSAAEDDKAYHMTVAMPGVRSADISATVDERTLRVTGETKTEHRHACINRSIELPRDADFSSEAVKVVHEDGILSVSVPKRGLQRRQLVICTPDPAATEEAGDSTAADAAEMEQSFA